MKGVELQMTCPACPVQYEGTVDGNPAYFRARWGNWTFDISKPGTDPIWPKKEDSLYSAGGDFADGFGPEDADDDAIAIIKRCVLEFRKKAHSAK